MLLIFGNERLDFREFPNLMTNRFGIGHARILVHCTQRDRHSVGTHRTTS